MFRMLLARFEIFQIAIVFYLTAFTCGFADESECFVKPQGVQHAWKLNEPLKIDILIPPKWSQNMEQNLNISIGKNYYILNSNQKTMTITPRYFISFSREQRPKAGWTTIFVRYRNNSVQFEDVNGIALRYPQVTSNLPSSELTHVNVTVEGMNALVNCNSNVRAFTVKDDYKDAQAILGMPIPVLFFRNLTRIEFYGNTTVFEVQLMLKERSFFICKNSPDPDSLELTIISNYALCGLFPNNIYTLNLNLSILNQKYTARNDDVTVGIVRIYASQATTYVRTFSSNTEIQLRSGGIETEAKSVENSPFIHYLPALIAVSISLAVIILLVIAAIVYYILRQKAKRRQEHLSSSGSWTQQNFDSLNSATDFYIRNEVYERPGAKGSKKFSISSEYSNPVDEEYDEPIYAEGRESIYESIYESAYVAPKDAGDK